jgi:hypothetical protein
MSFDRRISLMGWELDHLFVTTADVDAAERVLGDFGLALTERRAHIGQGTANRCVRFDAAFLEILFAEDQAALCSQVVRPLGLDERIRWRETGACPFGISFRPADPTEDERFWPFPTWPYRAAYLPPGDSLPIVTPADEFTDPMVFISRRERHGDGTPMFSRNRNAEPQGLPAIGRVVVRRPAAAPPISSGLRWFVDQGLLTIEAGTDHQIEIEQDHGSAGHSHDFGPVLPLVLRW